MLILGLGCNIGDRLAHLRQALNHLRAINELKITQISPVYESDAMLPENAPPEWDTPFLNFAIRCTTSLSAEKLLPKLKAIEVKMGRAEHLHWSPRIMDIDILAWNEECYQTEKLHVPHSGLLDRPFALWPLADVAPEWKYCLPNTSATGQTAKVLIKKWGSRFAGEAPFHTRQIAHRVDTPLMMGILNVTPDSFSDGGNYSQIDKAVEQAKSLFALGADIIDIGAESTRPGTSTPLTPQQEWQRLSPVLESVIDIWRGKNVKPKISVDTRHPETALKALQLPIDFLNDVTGFTNPAMRQAALSNDSTKLIFMHNLGIPPNQENILDENQDTCAQVYDWAEKQIENLVKMGINKDRLIFDVGIGFGKSAAQSFLLIKNIAKFMPLDIPILVGHSRKSFLNLFTDKPASERDIETVAFSNFLSQQKVHYLRVHDVDATMRSLKIISAL